VLVRSPRSVLGVTRERTVVVMANYSRWAEVKKRRPEPTVEVRANVEHDLALGQLIYDLRTAARLSQRVLAERMGTTQSVISRLEEGGGEEHADRSAARPVPAGHVTQHHREAHVTRAMRRLWVRNTIAKTVKRCSHRPRKCGHGLVGWSP
jgi:hypothetical protein